MRWLSQWHRGPIAILSVAWTAIAATGLTLYLIAYGHSVERSWDTCSSSEEALSTALWELDTTGLHSQGGEGGREVVIAYFADRPRLEEDLAGALRGLDVEIAPAAVPEVDWVARVRDAFRGFVAGSFRIVPAWERVIGRHRDKRLVVVAHGIVCKVLISNLVPGQTWGSLGSIRG